VAKAVNFHSPGNFSFASNVQNKVMTDNSGSCKLVLMPDNWQVATRFLSASAPLYWFAAYLMISPSSRRWGYLIWAYCAAYILLGSLLFPNFYPFT